MPSDLGAGLPRNAANQGLSVGAGKRPQAPPEKASPDTRKLLQELKETQERFERLRDALSRRLTK